MSVFAVVCSASSVVRVADVEQVRSHVEGLNVSWMPVDLSWQKAVLRPPTSREIVGRMALWGPLAIAAALGVLWTVRRLKSRRHTEPPVG